MAQIGYIILCDEVFDNNNNGITINNPYVELNPAVIPSQFSFTLSFSIFNIAPETHYNLKIQLFDPEGTNSIWDADLNFSPKTDINSPANNVFNIALRNILFEKKGIYKIAITLNWNDETDKAELNFPVRAQRGN